MPGDTGKPTIRLALVCAGGWGTRFLPFAKAVPKELLPIAGVPAIHHVVAECRAAGIERIVVVTRPGCDLTRRYFEPAPRLECYLVGRGDERSLQLLRQCDELGHHVRCVEERPEHGYGNAVPLLQLREELCAEQAFAVLFADDVVLGAAPAIGELARAFSRHQALSAIAMQRMPRSRLGQFGNLALGPRLDDDQPACFPLRELIQRPRPEQVRSDYAVVSRLIVTPAIFEQLWPWPGPGEIDLGLALARQARSALVLAVELSGCWVTVGDPDSYLEALQVAARLAPGPSQPEVRDAAS